MAQGANVEESKGADERVPGDLEQSNSNDVAEFNQIEELKPHRCADVFVNTYRSLWSRNAAFSVLSMNAVVGFFLLNGFFSFFSINAAFAVFSVNSILSIASVNSWLSIGCIGKSMTICV
jgi:hypothetical protein